MNNKNIILGAVVIAVIAGLVGFLFGRSITPSSDGAVPFGTIGIKPVEDYISIIKFNDGYYSELDITTTGNLTVDAAALSGALTVSANSTLTGTSTITASPDGFIAWDDFTMATTGVAAVYTNTHGPMMCEDTSGFAYWNSTGFSPSLIFSVGTSTSATSQTSGIALLASTTIATSTDTIVDFDYSAPFLLGSGESIVVLLSETGGNIASSTHWSNWSVEFSYHCWLLGE